MLVPGDLGFSYLVLLLFFVFSPIFGFVIRRKWTIAVARQEEIRRLMELASEQEARAAVEAAFEYGTVSVTVRQSQCAVCYRPTTTRCARCKAVRYWLHLSSHSLFCPLLWDTNDCIMCTSIQFVQELTGQAEKKGPGDMRAKISGKCQIIHWRQGHKDECHPPYATSQFNNEGTNSGQKAVLQGEQCKFSDNTELEDSCGGKPVETLSKEPASSKFVSCSEVPREKHDNKIEPLLDAKKTYITFESSSVSLLSDISASTGVDESSDDIYASKVPSLNPPGRSEAPQPVDTSSAKLKATTVVDDSKLNESPPLELNSLVGSEDSFSCSSKLKQSKLSCDDEVYSTSTSPSFSSSNDFSSSSNGSDESTTSESSTSSSDFWEGALDSSGSINDFCDNCTHSSVTEVGDIISSGSSSLQFSANCSRNNIPPSVSQPSKSKADVASEKSLRNEMPFYGASAVEKMVIDVPGRSNPPALIPEKADSRAKERSKDSHVLKSLGNRSLSSDISDLPCSRTGGHFAKSTKVDGIHVAPTAVLEAAHSSNASNGLKTSVSKVVQQFRASKISIYNPMGFGTENGGKHSCKMLFPYEQFAKLYHVDKVELCPFGLTNCGNSCYANAVLQCLAFTRPLACYLLQGHHSKACPKKEWCFTCEFEALILRAREGKSPLSPIGILSQIQNIGSHLGHGREEDAHEFLRYAIDAMQSICLREAGSNVDVPYAEETTLIGLIFGGYLRSKIRCLKCQGKSERIERMLDLTVEIEGDIGTLEEALAKFTTAEILDGENKYQCERCKSYEKAKKKLTVLEAPNVLTIALKRFQTGKFGKLNKLVRFPEVLNLTPYMNATSDKSPVYTLYAVVVHLDIMNAAFSGHYICYIKNFQGKWFKIDDSMVKPVEPEKVLSKGAYMLFYARCSPRAPSLVRNSLIHDDKVKRSRCSEAVPSSHSGNNMSNERPSVVPSASPKDLPFWTTTDGTINYGSFDSDNRSFRRHQIPKVDWFSDSSSLFSCSDEGSCSTESTRDSTSTEDLHDYIFGEAICGWKSPLRVSSDSDGASSPLGSSFSPQSMSKSHSLNSPDTSGYQTYSTKPETGKASTKLRDKSGIGEDLQGKERPPLLYSDTTKSCRKFTTHRSSSSGSSNSNSLGSCSCRETDRKRLGVVNPFGWRSGVTMRRGTRERAAQTFY
uniref:USP domain-containing protein n=1 Tax=Nelumbo nucifera TaxID=4432 RepID=A0A822XNV4_NELNU|nr:TPA_asm: hypothetical protein HUJ06_023553 [Nelumbo nucifera]